MKLVRNDDQVKRWESKSRRVSVTMSRSLRTGRWTAPEINWSAIGSVNREVAVGFWHELQGAIQVARKMWRNPPPVLKPKTPKRFKTVKLWRKPYGQMLTRAVIRKHGVHFIEHDGKVRKVSQYTSLEYLNRSMKQFGYGEFEIVKEWPRV